MADLRAGLSRIVRFETAPGPEWTDRTTIVTPVVTTMVKPIIDVSKLALTGMRRTFLG